jgi:hypothetical protein
MGALLAKYVDGLIPLAAALLVLVAELCPPPRR